MRRTLYVLTLLLLLVAPGSRLFADTEPFVVDSPQIIGEIRAGGSFDLSISINVNSDYFIYKDKTKLEFEPLKGFVFGPAILPQAKIKHDKFLGKDVEIYKGKVTLASQVSFAGNVEPGQYDIKLTVYYQGCSDVTCFLPQRKEFTLPVTVLPNNNEPQGSASISDDNSESSDIADKGLFGMMIFAFLAGIGLSFTPCIYPMIPITVAIIGGQESQKPIKGFYLSLIYVLGIAVVYSALGVVAASTGMLFGSAVNSPWVVGFVAVIFIALAFSMFGVYELQLPTSLAEKFGGKKKGMGVIGIFFMGMVSGTVASPCVGPVLVSLLVYIASTGSRFIGFWLLFVFAWGMGLLLIAVGTFSGSLKVLPKSGTWMEVVKKIMGILLIGAALYYLRAIMPEKIFLIVLGMFLIIVGIFSGGTDRLVSKSAVFTRVKKSFGFLCIIFGIYFLVGTLLLKGLILAPFAGIQSPVDSELAAKNKIGIDWVLSEDQGLKIAADGNMPIMIDFWAEWCSVCKKLEKKTLYEAGVVKESKRFVNIKIDCTDVDDPDIKNLWVKYGIVGLPTIVFIDENGSVVKGKTINGFVNASDFKKIMSEI
ncbi:MAG: protein-disulfide reductase DsbD family protein [Candidatus Anammoxibacter sp.]